MNKVIIRGFGLTLEDVINVARNNFKVELAPEAIERVNASREIVDRFVNEGKVVYGITTGFGKFSDTVITKEDTAALQRNLIISHACGVGKPFDIATVRAIMLLRINNLLKGYSGIRLSTLETLLAMLNEGVHPVIPEKGSLGASGDLAPLSHMVLVMLGEGDAWDGDNIVPGAEAMKKAGIAPIELAAKEGLALINGTQVMNAVGALTAYDAIRLMKLSDMSAALTIEALRGITDAYDPRIHQLRPHQGQLDTAANLLNLLEGSTRTTRQGEIRVQDAYTLRCIPQIHGASKDAVEFIKGRVEIEMNAVTDNPIIIPDDESVISGGHFHGQPMALPFDYMGIALAEIANASERRTERMVNPALSGLPAFLTPNGGLHSGFMIAQYAAAALVSENKVLAHPASVDSIPSSANQEDHVSMGTIAARKAREIFENVANVLAVELMCACQAIDLDPEGKLGKGTQVVYDVVRKQVAPFMEDRETYRDMNKIFDMIEDHEIVEAVEKAMGPLTGSTKSTKEIMDSWK